MTHTYTPNYPGVIAATKASGKHECGHLVVRPYGLIPLSCVRPARHEGNHLHDVPPSYRKLPEVVIGRDALTGKPLAAPAEPAGERDGLPHEPRTGSRGPWARDDASYCRHRTIEGDDTNGAWACVRCGTSFVKAEAAALDPVPEGGAGLDRYLLHHAMRNVARRNVRAIDPGRDFGSVADEYERLARLATPAPEGG